MAQHSIPTVLTVDRTRQVTALRIHLVFDADQSTSGTALQQAKQAIEQINQVLQREPYNLAAQVYWADRGPEAIKATFQFLD